MAKCLKIVKMADCIYLCQKIPIYILGGQFSPFNEWLFSEEACVINTTKSVLYISVINTTKHFTWQQRDLIKFRDLSVLRVWQVTELGSRENSSEGN